MEFYENGGGAMAKLLWSSASQAKQAIQQSQLYPATAGNAQVDFQWMVNDQLGSPRMVIDKSGSLAGVKRRDFLPFGEDLQTGGRTWLMGYVSDSVRQKFTGYERDSETNLDYAHARYFSSGQGRFTGVDPLLGSATASNPQTWNRYSYGLNNPLRYNDPSGMSGNDIGTAEDQRRQQAEQKPPPAAPLRPIIPPISSDLEGTSDYVNQRALAPRPNVTVTPGQTEPLANVPIEGGFLTGVVSIFEIQVTDEAGQPIPGLNIVESNDTTNDTNGLPMVENRSATQTNAEGLIFDIVTGNATKSPKQLSLPDARQAIANQVESNTSVTTTQTLTLFAPGYGVLGTAVYDRTFTNMVGKNRLPATNSRGNHINNFTVTKTPLTMSYP